MTRREVGHYIDSVIFQVVSFLEVNKELLNWLYKNNVIITEAHVQFIKPIMWTTTLWT